MKSFVVLAAGLLFSFSANANGVNISPAEFGDQNSLRVFTLSQDQIQIEISGAKAKEIYDALKVPPRELSDFPGTFSKRSSDGNLQCYQGNLQNDAGAMVLKTKCIVASSKI